MESELEGNLRKTGPRRKRSPGLTSKRDEKEDGLVPMPYEPTAVQVDRSKLASRPSSCGERKIKSRSSTKGATSDHSHGSCMRTENRITGNAECEVKKRPTRDRKLVKKLGHQDREPTAAPSHLMLPSGTHAKPSKHEERNSARTCKPERPQTCGWQGWDQCRGVAPQGRPESVEPPETDPQWPHHRGRRSCNRDHQGSAMQRHEQPQWRKGGVPERTKTGRRGGGHLVEHFCDCWSVSYQ